MTTAVLHVHQGVKCDTLSQNARARMDNFNALSDKDTQGRRMYNYLNSEHFIQQNAAQFCAVTLKTLLILARNRGKIPRTSPQTVQVTSGILICLFLSVNSEKNIKGLNSQGKDKSSRAAEHRREPQLLTQLPFQPIYILHF